MPLPAMAPTFVTLSLCLVSLVLPTINAQSCFFPNGTDANRLHPRNPDYTPCNAGDAVSMCCHVGDSCRKDGLCLSTFFDGNVWRDLCTDKTWESPSCVKLCVAGSMAESYADNPRQRAAATVTVTPCGDGSYCCGNGTAAETCCSTKKGLFIDKEGNAVDTNPTGTASRAAASGSKTFAPIVASVTVTSTPDKKRAVSIGAIVGAAIAAVAVLAGIAVGIFIVIRKRRRIRNAGVQGDKIRDGMKYSEVPNNQVEPTPMVGIRKEPPVSDGRIQGDVELDGGQQRYEMHDEHVAELGQGPVVRHELGS